MERIIYARLSNDRAAQFKIRTLIVKTDEGLKVVKQPDTKEAVPHVAAMGHHGIELAGQYQNSRFVMNACHMENGAAVFGYIEGDSLEEAADRLLKEEGPERAEEFLLDAAAQMLQGQTVPFAVTEEFRSVFGDVDVSFLEGKACCAYSNIDMILSNIFVQGEKWVVTDYEWTYGFPIPADYLVYRMLHYYVESAPHRRVIDPEGLYQKSGISVPEVDCYVKLEQAFQRYIDGTHMPLRALYGVMGKHVVDVQEYYRSGLISLQIFYDRGEGCSEQDSYRVKAAKEPASFHLTVPVPENAKMVRIDPMDTAGIVMLGTLRFEGEEHPAEYSCNGTPLGGSLTVFAIDDPMFLVPCEGKRALHVQLTAEKLGLETAQGIAEAVTAATASAAEKKGFFKKWM